MSKYKPSLNKNALSSRAFYWLRCHRNIPLIRFTCKATEKWYKRYAKVRRNKYEATRMLVRFAAVILNDKQSFIIIILDFSGLYRG